MSEQKDQPQKEKHIPIAPKPEPQRDPSVRYLIRICNTDLDGSKPVYHALSKIKGIGKMYSNAICVGAKIDPFIKLGKLKDTDVAKLNDVIKNPMKYNIPKWLFNRRKDPIDGNDFHLLTSDLDFVQSNDIKFMQKIRCYKGVRHMLGQPVRGQRTRSNFRKNKGKVVGVVKKSIAPAAVSDKDKK